MSIIAPADFILNEALPIDTLGDALQKYINKYEPIILTRVLTYQLYKEFNTGISAETPDEKWTNLLNGAEYTYENELKYFEGVKIVIVNYVYFKYIKEQSQSNSGVGIKKVTTENSTDTDATFKQVFSYNEMVDINEQLKEFMSVNDNVYDNYKYTEINKVNEYNF